MRHRQTTAGGIADGHGVEVGSHLAGWQMHFAGARDRDFTVGVVFVEHESTENQGCDEADPEATMSTMAVVRAIFATRLLLMPAVWQEAAGRAVWTCSASGSPGKRQESAQQGRRAMSEEEADRNPPATTDAPRRPSLSDEGKEKVEQMRAAYDDDRQTAVLPGTDNTITGVASQRMA